ncbi:MAG: acylphosphatase [Anaerolineales bacterium]|nr:acylphosphatase [Anaerolineales bacterium]
MNLKNLARLHARIDGRVQGVGFRYFVQKNAVNLELLGWVRNRWDGSVEVLVEAPQDALEKLLKALQRGPRAGTTSDVKYEWLTATGEFQSFRIRRTG